VQDLEALVADRSQLQYTARVHIEIHDSSRAADRMVFSGCADFAAPRDEAYAKRAVLGHASPDHIEIAGLENPKGQDTVRKQYGPQREKRELGASVA
jgi:hypothetical protein